MKITKVTPMVMGTEWRNITFVFIQGESPFSFFNYIFWNRVIDIESPIGQQILQHELVHAQKVTICLNTRHLER